MSDETFKIVQPDWIRIFKWTYWQCVDFKEKSLNQKYLIKSKVRQWKIVENIDLTS